MVTTGRVATTTTPQKLTRHGRVAQLVARNHNLTAILTDLIAELRERAPYYGPATMFVFQGMADRAEARLREVGDE